MRWQMTSRDGITCHHIPAYDCHSTPYGSGALKGKDGYDG